MDFSAYMAYGYVVSDEEKPSMRVCQGLAAFGWPIVQGTYVYSSIDCRIQYQSVWIWWGGGECEKNFVCWTYIDRK